MQTFKIRDRVFHETKGFATVLWSRRDMILLELDEPVGSEYQVSVENTNHVAGPAVRAGRHYWRASAYMVSLVANNKFKGNIK